MKKRIFSIIFAILCLLLTFSLVACNDDTDPNKDDDYNEYESSKFSVSFNSNGGTDFSEYNLKDVVYGSFISKPAKNGVEDKPLKEGYTFSHWAVSGDKSTDVFTEGKKKVTSNLELIAQYNAKTYTHDYKLYDEEHFPGMGDDYMDFVSISSDTLLKSTYNSSADTFAVPSTTKPDDSFAYWYYYNKDGEEVVFTSWATKDSSTVNAASKYTFDHKLTLYAKWHSMLPDISVIYTDSLSEATYGTSTFKLKDEITAEKSGDKVFPVEKSGDANFDGYILSSWYYVAEDKDGNSVKHDFNFKDDKTSGTVLNEDVITKDENGNYSVTLYAKWQAKTVVGSETDFAGLYTLIENEATRELILNAKIEIADDITLTGTYAPVFDGDNVFNGVIDGGIYNAEGAYTGKHTITGGTFEGEGCVSMFGESSGAIKNLILKNTVFSLTGDTQEYIAAPFLSKNSGSVSGCEFYGLTSGYSINAEGKTVYFGGIAAISSAGDITSCKTSQTVIFNVKKLSLGGIVAVNQNTTITNCEAALTARAVSENAGIYYIGGITGENKSGIITKCKSDATLTSVSAESVYIGGIAGYNVLNGSISKSESSLTATAAASKNLWVGGIAGGNAIRDITSSISNCKAIVNLNVNSDGALYAGGITGEGAGKISYSYAEGNINAQANGEKTLLYVGGIIACSNGATLSNVFTLCDIACEIPEDYTAVASIGYSVGKATSSSSYTNVYYASDIALTLNENDLKSETSEFKPTEKSISDIKAATKENFKTASWIAANLDTTSTKSGFNNTEIWTVADGSLPILL